MLEEMIDAVLEVEGGYVNHPNDPGGPTNMGITLRTLEGYRGELCSRKDVADLQVWEARAIYLSLYWSKPGFAKLGVSEAVAEMIFDAAVNHGPSRATKLLQNSIGVLADGVMGPITIKFASRLDSNILAGLFMAERVRFYGRIITSNPDQAVFAAGWMNRCAKFIQSIPSA